MRRAMPPREFLKRGQRVGLDDRSRRAGHAKPMLDVGGRLRLVERPQQTLHAQPLFPLRHSIDRRQERRLPDQQERQRGLAVRLEIQKEPQGFERVALSISWASSMAMTACRPFATLAARNRSIRRTLVCTLGVSACSRRRRIRRPGRPADRPTTFAGIPDAQTEQTARPAFRAAWS